jgi:hypothetical protein
MASMASTFTWGTLVHRGVSGQLAGLGRVLGPIMLQLDSLPHKPFVHVHVLCHAGGGDRYGARPASFFLPSPGSGHCLTFVHVHVLSMSMWLQP